MPNYSYLDLVASVKGRLHNALGQLTDIRVTLNDGVGQTSDIDFRSQKRKSTLAPNLFNDIYQYTCPTDLKGLKIVGLQPQSMDRSRSQKWELTNEEEFDQRKQSEYNLLAFSDRDFTRKLLVSADVDDVGFTVAPLNALTGEGTWTAYGDATNLTVDTDEYMKGNASIKFDISSAGGTTAGITAADITTFDLTNYASAGSVFVWVYITSATNLTNYKLRLGNDASNYYSMTATTTNEGLAFSAGWNLLRFDFSGKSTTGTLSLTTCDYAALYMTKAAGKISETDYRFDHIIVKKGKIYNLIYYTNYPWQTSAGVYIPESTADTDVLNLDIDEYDVVVNKVVEVAAGSMQDYDAEKMAMMKYEKSRKDYLRSYRSEALQSQSTYYYV